jgi:hypothetical protein
MANEFYRKSGSPNIHTVGSVTQLNSEYAAAASGFDKFPALLNNASKLLAVNESGTAIEAVNEAVIDSLLTTSGYYVFPGDNQLILQWVTASPAGPPDAQTVTLPITFPNAILHVIPGCWQQDWDSAPAFVYVGINFSACTTSQIAYKARVRTSTSGSIGVGIGIGMPYRFLAWGN